MVQIIRLHVETCNLH